MVHFKENKNNYLFERNFTLCLFFFVFCLTTHCRGELSFVCRSYCTILAHAIVCLCYFAGVPSASCSDEEDSKASANGLRSSAAWIRPRSGTRRRWVYYTISKIFESLSSPFSAFASIVKAGLRFLAPFPLAAHLPAPCLPSCPVAAFYCRSYPVSSILHSPHESTALTSSWLSHHFIRISVPLEQLKLRPPVPRHLLAP
jgi:hypothetical protein